MSPNIARTLRGFYAEGAYRIWQQGAGRDVVGFARYENYDTQFRMPSGYIPLKQFDRDAWIAGAASIRIRTSPSKWTTSGSEA